MSSLAELDNAISAQKTARVAVIIAAKEAITDALGEAFANPQVMDITWGVRTSPYDDEGLSSGITGPNVNAGMVTFDEETGDMMDIDTSRWYKYLDYTTDGRASKLGSILNKLDTEIVQDIFGTYDEGIVIVYRTDKVGNYDIETESAGY